MQENYCQIAVQQKNFFDSGATVNHEFRKNQLQILKLAIKKQQNSLLQSLQQDLNKPEFEAYLSEIVMIEIEINHAIKNLKKWLKPQKVATPITLFYAKSYIYNIPLGVVLIIAPWNYPVQLLLSPLIGAIAAGNCVILKPSEHSTQTTLELAKLIKNSFNPEYISLITGDGITVLPDLLKNFKFNHVFFTGSTKVGREIATLCADQLIPYTLELGGKSPVIIDKSADLQLAAKRIAWGKFFNAGQTCVAPDYVLVPQELKEEFINHLIKILTKFYPPESIDYFPKIINQIRFDFLINSLKQQKVIYGGNYDSVKLKIFPTVIDQPDLNSELMQTEIFAPILAILSYSSEKQIFATINRYPNPLALYIFSNNTSFKEMIINRIAFGGGCVNTTIAHLANNNLPFGGVMNSGQGNYHGKYSFLTFSHQKSIVKMATWVDIFIKYPPYNRLKLKLIKLLTVG